jgi:hypothetical protein
VIRPAARLPVRAPYRHVGLVLPAPAEIPKAARSAVRRHEYRKTKTGQVMQRLVHPDQRPEPGMLMLLRHAKSRCTKSLGAVDRDVNGKIDQGDKPEPWRDDQDQRHCNRKVHKAMGQQRQRPSGLLVLADGHPGRLQDKIGDDVLDGKQQHPTDQRAYRNGRGHGGKRQTDALAGLEWYGNEGVRRNFFLKPGDNRTSIDLL